MLLESRILLCIDSPNRILVLAFDLYLPTMLALRHWARASFLPDNATWAGFLVKSQGKSRRNYIKWAWHLKMQICPKHLKSERNVFSHLKGIMWRRLCAAGSLTGKWYDAQVLVGWLVARLPFFFYFTNSDSGSKSTEELRRPNFEFYSSYWESF